MSKIYLLDCTLRDGGYINDWRFGADTIRGFSRKIAQTGVEFFEVGFLRGDDYDPDCTLYPDAASTEICLEGGRGATRRVAMVDMQRPVPLGRIPPCADSPLDGIRVIFKKDRIDEAFAYGEAIREKGYLLFMNFVGTDQYTDAQFIEAVRRMNALSPFAMTIVDSFGLIRRKDFLRLVYLADHNMREGVVLGYHAHNNLQQAMGNAQALCEMNLRRDVCIDACVFGMGRGAGNLNLELFAEYMNENYGTRYRVEPMLEIMDEYLNHIYREKFWGYSLPLYLSASTGCHPNYAICLGEKNTLTVKAFHELLQGIPAQDKASFSREKAERYYRAYQENYIDDRETVERLRAVFGGRTVLLLAPGRTLRTHAEAVLQAVQREAPIVLAVNFTGEVVKPDFIFSSNMRRFVHIQGKTDVPCITTSNMRDAAQSAYTVNFTSYACAEPDILDNSGLMALHLLTALQPRAVLIAGMDGYAPYRGGNYADSALEYTFGVDAAQRNRLIADELREIGRRLPLRFITPTQYEQGEQTSWEK